MRKIIFLFLLLPVLGMAQIEDKYMAGAVPVENKRVVFTKNIEVPLSADDMYNAVKEWADEQYKVNPDMPNNRVNQSNPLTHEVNIDGEEFIVFSSRPLSLDRTRIYYKINIKCKDKKCTARIFNVRYWYNEEREGGQRYKAEEWITDEMAFNKKGTKLSRLTGKFRIKTVDRVEEIFNNLEMFISRKAMKNMMIQ